MICNIHDRMQINCPRALRLDYWAQGEGKRMLSWSISHTKTKRDCKCDYDHDCNHGKFSNNVKPANHGRDSKLMYCKLRTRRALFTLFNGVLLSWEPEGHYCQRLCTATAPFWFSMEHCWTVLNWQFSWLSAD